MSDPNSQDFNGRVARIEQARALGYGFEAEGTLGRSYYHRPNKPRRSWLKPLVLVLLCTFGVKGMIHAKIGDATYQARVAGLLASSGFDRVGGVLMTADPVTLALSAQLRRILG